MRRRSGPVRSGSAGAGRAAAVLLVLLVAAPAVRLLVVYLNGFMPFGQFFSNTQLSNVGAELQVRF